MTPAELLSRKYRQGYSDAEAIFLLRLREFPMSTLSELIDLVGLPPSTGHEAIATLRARGFITTPPDHKPAPFRRTPYYLTDDGHIAINNLLR